MDGDVLAPHLKDATPEPFVVDPDDIPVEGPRVHNVVTLAQTRGMCLTDLYLYVG